MEGPPCVLRVACMAAITVPRGRISGFLPLQLYRARGPARRSGCMLAGRHARFLKEPACADSVKLRLSLCLWQALQPSFARVPRGS